jgi:hypothetical protein
MATMTVSAPHAEPASSETAVLPEPRRESFLPTAFQIWIGISIGMAINFAGVGQLFSEWGVPLSAALALLGGRMISSVLIGIGGALLFRAIQAKQLAWMQPGHWLAVESLALLLSSLLGLLLQSEFLFAWVTFFLVAVIPQMAECAVGATWYGLVIRQQRENRAWQLFAWASALLFGVTGLSFILMLAPEWSGLDAVVKLLLFLRTLLAVGRWLIAAFATANDLRTGNGRDTLHWLGLGCSAIGIVMFLIQAISIYFM